MLARVARIGLQGAQHHLPPRRASAGLVHGVLCWRLEVARRTVLLVVLCPGVAGTATSGGFAVAGLKESCWSPLALVSSSDFFPVQK